jgi:hypothetical protein
VGSGAHLAGPLRLGRAAAPSDPQMSKTLIFGSLDGIGFRHVPLISVHLSERFSLDGYASWAVDLGASAVQRSLLGRIHLDFVARQVPVARCRCGSTGGRVGNPPGTGAAEVQGSQA